MACHNRRTFSLNSSLSNNEASNRHAAPAAHEAEQAARLPMTMARHNTSQYGCAHRSP